MSSGVPTAPDTLCACTRCSSINPNGLLVPQWVWRMHSDAQPVSADNESLASMAFSTALHNDDTRDFTSPTIYSGAGPDVVLPYFVESAERLSMGVYSQSTGYGDRQTNEPVLQHEGSMSASAPSVNIPAQIPTPQSPFAQSSSKGPTQQPAPSTLNSLAAAPRSKGALDKNLRSLDLLHLRIQDHLDAMPIATGSLPFPTVPSFLTTAESDLESLTEWSSRIKSKHPSVIARKKEVSLDLALLNTRVIDWRRLYPVVERRTYDTDYCYNKRAASADEAVQVALFLGVSCQILFGMGRTGCDYILKIVAIIVNTVLRRPPNDRTDPRVRMIPSTIETAESQFNLEPRTTVHAVCPECHCTYAALDLQSNPPRYPSQCSNRPNAGSAICQAALLDEAGKPLKRYEYNHLDDYIALLLSHPRLEKNIDEFCKKTSDACKGPPSTTFNDVSDGGIWRILLGADGKPFVDGGNEARIVLSLSIDYFPTEGSSNRGAHSSTGVISAACLNLPAEIRYDTANMYLVGVVPGPTEPKKGEEAYYIRPLVDDLEKSYKDGVLYTRTASCPDCGRVARAAIAALVVDFPAGRRTAGLQSVSSHHFCSVCDCEHEAYMGRTDFENWEHRDPARLHRLAEEYAGSFTSWNAQERFSTNTGMRDSELWRLPYWNPVLQLTVDPMHCLFERICHRYTREVLSLQLEPPPKVYKPTHAYSYPFRSPFVKSTNSSHSTNDPLVIDIAVDFPEYIGEDIEENLRKILTDTTPGWRSSVPALHEILTIPVGKSQQARDALIKLLEGKQLNALVYVCADLGLSLSGLTTTTPKIELAILLANWRLRQPTTLPPFIPTATHGLAALGRVRDVISKTVRPSSVTSVPSDYGAKGQGSMKADQWKALWCVYIPLALITFWGLGAPKRAGNADLMLEVLENAMALAAVVRLACQRSITKEQAGSYREMLRKHVEGLKKLFPGFLLPSHHLAFHIYDFILLFGPAKSWWCFPFERLIGQLQRRTSHNHKLGELESTMLHSFVRGSKLRQWLYREDSPPAIQECKRLFQENNNSFESRSGADDKFYHQACTQELGTLIGDASVDQASQIYRHGTSYSTHERHRGNAQVLIEQDQGSPLPFRICHIIRHGGIKKVAVQRLVPAPENTPDPFSYFPYFDAWVFSTSFSSELELFPCDKIVGQFALYEMTSDLSAIVSLLRD